MILGRVVGSVWTTKKNRRLAGHKLLLVKPYVWYEPAHDVDLLVAIDRLDAGVGDDVVVCMGIPPRWSAGHRHMPVEAAVMAVVDRVDVADWALQDQGMPLHFIDDEPPRSLRSVEGVQPQGAGSTNKLGA